MARRHHRGDPDHPLPRPPPEEARLRLPGRPPFANLTGAAANEYVADGLTDSVISDLAHIPELRVISRTSAMHYKNTRKALPDIAKELEVAADVPPARRVSARGGPPPRVRRRAWRNDRCDTRTLGALSAMEPNALWLKPVLEMRALCYRNAALTDLAQKAQRDLAEFQPAEARAISSSAPSARASPRP
jgi:hypothetical protein